METRRDRLIAQSLLLKAQLDDLERQYHAAFKEYERRCHIYHTLLKEIVELAELVRFKPDIEDSNDGWRLRRTIQKARFALEDDPT
jgi:hypothetical protein